MEALGGKPLHLAEEEGLPAQLLRQEAGHLGPRGHPGLPGAPGQEEGEDASRWEDLHQEKGPGNGPQAQVNPAHPAMIP